MIKVVCVGNVKEKSLRDLITEYLKRIQKYTKIDIIEVPDYDLDVKDTLKKEAESVLRNINIKDYVITLEINGNNLDSLEFAEKIRTTQISNSNITFVIGGSYGLDQSIKERSNYKLSFSKLTFPHQLFRVILLEQIYRAYKINNNETYHK